MSYFRVPHLGREYYLECERLYDVATDNYIKKKRELKGNIPYIDFKRYYEVLRKFSKTRDPNFAKNNVGWFQGLVNMVDLL